MTKGVHLSKYTPSNLVNTRISKILVAIDGSVHSFKASEYALELAKSFGAQLYAVTVTYIPESDHLSQKEVLSKSLVEDSSNNGMKDADFTQNAKEDNIQLKTELINSARPVDYVILEYAEEQKIDLIVVGTKGRTGFKKLMLGSIASSIVTYAHCPVIVVK